MPFFIEIKSSELGIKGFSINRKKCLKAGLGTDK
jgi:hypothetical protein